MNLNLIIDLSGPSQGRYLLQHKLIEHLSEIKCLCFAEADGALPGRTWGMVLLKPSWRQGLELIAAIGRAQPRIGILVTHAGLGLSECVEAYAEGADIFTNRPVSDEELSAMMEAIVRRQMQTLLRAESVSANLP